MDSALDNNVVEMAKCSSPNCSDMSLASAETHLTAKNGHNGRQLELQIVLLDMILVLIAIVQ